MASSARRVRLTATDWAEAALAALAEGGLAAVAVEPLAARLGATKGSFYWHFANRDALVAAAMQAWEQRRTDEVIALVAEERGPRERLRALLTRAFTPTGGNALEAQILAAADHPLVADAVRRVIGRRVSYVIDLLEQFGFAPEAAASRAVLLYAAYAGHDQLLVRVPGVLPFAACGGFAAYTDAVLELMLAGVESTS